MYFFSQAPFLTISIYEKEFFLFSLNHHYPFADIAATIGNIDYLKYTRNSKTNPFSELYYSKKKSSCTVPSVNFLKIHIENVFLFFNSQIHGVI